MTVFDSRNKLYKSKICAIATDEQVKLTIIVPRSMGCSDAILAVHKDEENTVYYSMFWAGMCGNDHEYWDIHFYATTPGLYWYHFEIDTVWGRSYIGNIGNGIGEFTPELTDFQQTVYDKNYKTPKWLQGGIIYQIFPDRFYNSKTPKSNVNPNRVMRNWKDTPFYKEEQMNGLWNNDYFGGDLKGIEQKLAYISDLGVNCIYINPIFEANSNHRYDTADYEKIDSLLGTEEDFKSLCKTAKEKYNISIILDGVFSHTGCDSKYFNIYNHYDTVGAYNSQKSPYYSWYKFINWPDEYHSWWGIKLLPEVIEENEDYRNYICGKNGIIQKWLDCGAKGYRLDVADELPDVFLDDLRKSVKSKDEDAIIIGEVWEDATTKYAYNQRRRYFLGNQLDSVMNYPFADAILDFVKYGNGYGFFNIIMTIIENYPKQVLNVLMNHISTHDTQRAINVIAGDDCNNYGRQWQYEHNKLTDEQYTKGVKLLKIASLIQFTLPGVPSIYYGDEIGMQGQKDPFNRMPMKWNDIDNDLLKWYKRLGEIRNGLKAFVDGEFNQVYCNQNAIAYTRNCNSNQVLIAINLNQFEVDIEVDEIWNNSYSLFNNNCVNSKIHLKFGEFSLLSK